MHSLTPTHAHTRACSLTRTRASAHTYRQPHKRLRHMLALDPAQYGAPDVGGEAAASVLCAVGEETFDEHKHVWEVYGVRVGVVEAAGVLHVPIPGLVYLLFGAQC